MSNLAKFRIQEIESVTEEQARDSALETLSIKGHTIYLVDFGGTFGYSCLVFCNGRHIYYANDYQLHHGTVESLEELRQLYINKLNNILFTEDEIDQPLKDYDEYTRKDYFLRNYYNMREEYVSMFGSFNDPEFTKQYEKKTANMIRDVYSFCYYPADKADFIRHHYELVSKLQKRRREMQENFEYQKGAFLYEMYNHEYGINWEADYDVLSCFGKLEYAEDESLDNYFDQLKFNDVQRRAYRAARSEYYAHAQF
ncbi:MAG: hypothetical protein IKM73_00105 [Acidaminococcaceae bacterium]|nr:hypothetical protein [Acidaminococcaceae bacterium]